MSIHGYIPDVTDLQSIIDAASGQSRIEVSGTFSITSSIKMRPGLEVAAGPAGAKITDPTGLLPTLVDWGTYSANGALLTGFTVDACRIPNTTAAGVATCHLGSVTGAGLRSCRVVNSSGNAVLGYGAGVVVEDCTLDNIGIFAVALLSSTGPLHRHRVRRNTISNHGQTAIYVQNSRFADVSRNIITCNTMRGFNVAVDGSKIITSYGAYFTPDCVGRFLVIGGGFESLITRFISGTQVEVNLPMGPAGYPLAAAYGQGDSISLQSCSDSDFCDNEIFGGVTSGIVLYSEAGASADRNRIIGNKTFATGSAGIFLQNQNLSGGTAYVRDTQVSGNLIVDAGSNGAASAIPSNVGIAIEKNLTFGLVVTDNTVLSYGAPTQYGISCNAAVTEKHVANNNIRGMVIAPTLNC